MHGYLRHLANFARIVEAGSMKAASDALGIAPSGLSDSVRILENRLGTALLVRHKSGVSPTSEGERVYASAAGIVDLLNDVVGPKDDDDLSGTCRLSVPTEVANTCIGRVVRHLRDTHPKLDLRIFAEDELVDHTRFSRDYFLRIAAPQGAKDGLRTIWTGQIHAILVASAALIPEEATSDTDVLSEQQAIMAAQRKPPYRFPLANPKGQIVFKRALGLSHPAARLSLAEQGLGVTGCLDICAADAIRSGRLRRILPDRFSIPLEARLVTPHRRKTPVDDALVGAIEHLQVLID